MSTTTNQIIDINSSEFLNKSQSGAFELPTLQNPYDAFAEYIDAQTMELHHSKHHQTYVNKLNEAIQKYPDLASKPVEELVLNLSSMPTDIQGAVRNHGGGHANHCLFWDILSMKQCSPSADLSKAIDSSFGNYSDFEAKMIACAVSVFGSGWAWLTLNNQSQLTIMGTPNQDSPLSQGLIPILGIDVWEHAYYLKYQNRRPEYINNIMKNINWDNVSARYNDATKIIQ